MHGESKGNLKNIFCSFTENWKEWESDQRENGQQGNETFGKFSIQSNLAILDGQGSQKLFEIVELKMTNITTVFVDTRLWKTKHPRKCFQNFRQSCVLSTDRIEIHQSQPLV